MSGSDPRDGVPLAPTALAVPVTDASRRARSVPRPAGRPAADSLAVALLSFASALIAPRLAVARRSLAHRVALLAVPADSRGLR